MNIKILKSLSQLLLIMGLALIVQSCFNTTTKESNNQNTKTANYPSDVIPFMDQFKILLGNGKNSNKLVNFEDKDFFYTTNDGTTDWVVYKTPNSGTTSKNSSNTRTELHQIKEWVPETGGKLTGTCKVPSNCFIKNSQVTVKDLCFGIMKSIQKVIIKEDGIFHMMFGGMICQ